MGLAASARIGAAVGFNCEDFSTDSDNEFGCVGDTGAVESSPQLTLLNPAAFEILWGTRSADIGGITVAAAPPPEVPVPPALPLMGAAFVLLGILRRRAA